MPNLPLPILTAEQINRFISLIGFRGEDECWPWLGPVNHSSYGEFNIGQKSYKATRLMLKAFTGGDPGDKQAIHTCENNPDTLAPLCVNPKHLKAGTHKENMEYTRGRLMLTRLLEGEKHGRSKITDAQGEEILKRRADGESCQGIAQAFNLTTSEVSHITTGRNWQHLGGPRTKGNSGGYKMTPEMIQKVFELRALGYSKQKISDHLGGVINQSMVSKILKRGY